MGLLGARRWIAVLRIARPHNAIATAAAVWCGYHISGGAGWAPVLAPCLLTAAATGLGNLVNDVFDVEADRVNKPRRPIPAGDLPLSVVRQLYWLGSITLTALAVVHLARPLVLLLVSWQVLLYLYGRFGKRLPVVGNIVVAAVVASSFVMGAFVQGGVDAVVFPMVLAFLLVLGRELLKGAEDVVGDARAGAATLAVRIGWERTVRVGVVPLFACVMAAPVPALVDHYGPAYALAAQLLFVPGVLAASTVALRAPVRAALGRASYILKVQMFIGILAIALGRM